MVEKSIENAINEKLSGESQKNALNLAAFLQANNMTLDANEDGVGWAVGGTIGNSVGYMLVNGIANDPSTPGPWTLWFNSCNFNDDGSVSEELKETARMHASPCGKCHAGWETCGGGNRNIFGKEFEKLCHSPLMFNEPTAEVLEDIKKLLLLVK